jgi:hypothetical protein
VALKVIGAGLSRTGTLSMKWALEHLGFAPCYHGAEIALPRSGFNDGHLDAWYDFYVLGKPFDWSILGAYKAFVDAPACLHYGQLLETFPGARVVLTVRDPDDWFDSWQALWHAIDDVNKPDRIVRFHRFPELFKAMLDRHFDGKVDRRSNIDVFNRHNAAVRRDVPADRLLEFNVTDGWGPLCAFLEVDVPTDPFPRRNDRPMTRSLLEAALWTHAPLQL